MRSIISILFAIGIFYIQATSGAVIPKKDFDWFSWLNTQGWKYELKNGIWHWKHYGHGRPTKPQGGNNGTAVTRPAGTGPSTALTITPPFSIPNAKPTVISQVATGTVVPTAILTGEQPVVTASPTIHPGGNGDGDEDGDETDEPNEFPASSTYAAGQPTNLPTFTSDVETTPEPTDFPASSSPSSNEGTSTTKLSPSESTAYSPPIRPTSGDSEVSSTATIQTQTVVPIPEASSTGPSTLKTDSTTAAPTATAVPTTPGSYWKPAVGATWQIQLHGTVTDINLPVDVYDIDLVESTPDLITSLHNANKKVICYFSAGSFESWRPDASSFAASDKGSPLEGWDNEWWLNTNSPNVRDIMKKRLDLAKSKGCDGVDPDNVDVYHNSNGLGITEQNSVDYLTFLANEAHSRGMAMGMKNGLEMVGKLLSIMDFHVNEQCVQFNECDKLVPFIEAGKPVFHIEYPENAPSMAKSLVDQDCRYKGEKGFSSVLKTMELDAWVQAC